MMSNSDKVEDLWCRSFKFIVLSLLIFIALTLTACGSKDNLQALEKSEPSFSHQDIHAGMGDNVSQFSTTLFQNIYKENENQMISPYSIASALSMVLAGAEGETRKELLEALHMNNITEEELHTSHQALLDILRNVDDDVTFLVANSIWTKKDIGFNDNFINLLEKYYDAEVDELTTVKNINDWVKEKTYGRIDRMIEEIPHETVMILMNAVYFLGEWSTPFEPQFTKDGSFFTPSSEVSVPFMSRGGFFRYEQTENYEVIQLPFGSRRFTMEVLLPEENSSVENVLKLWKEGEASWNSPDEGGTGVIRLPKFEFSTSLELNEALEQMGMLRSFNSDDADFTRMTTEYPLFIQKVYHRSYINVNEAGTEAAAVTSVEMDAGSAEPEEPFEMIVNRPFLFRIIDEETGIVLFMGHVVNPK